MFFFDFHLRKPSISPSSHVWASRFGLETVVLFCRSVLPFCSVVLFCRSVLSFCFLSRLCDCAFFVAPIPPLDGQFLIVSRFLFFCAQFSLRSRRSCVLVVDVLSG
jgi:hypothetical protein